MKSKSLSPDRIREALTYDPETGVFRRRRDGKVAGGVNPQGYVVIKLDDVLMRAHRIANLRDVPRETNMQNVRRPRVHAASQVLGVAPLPSKRNPWRASLRFNGRTRYLGAFPTQEAAQDAYLTAKRRLHEGCTI